MNVHAVKERENKKTIGVIFIFFIILTLIPMCLPVNLWAQDTETIAQGNVAVKGVTLDVDPAQLTVPVNTPTTVNTVFSMDTELLVRGMVVKGELRGPGLSKPMALTTLPNHPFSIPGLSVKGDYYLENIRLERDGKMLLKALHESILIQAIDMIITRVETRPLTMEEIREKGINITDDNFTVFNFSIGLMLESEEVQYNIPVVYKDQGQPYIPDMQGGQMVTNNFQYTGPVIGNQNVAFTMKMPSLNFNDSIAGGELDSGGGTIPGLLIFNNDIAFLNQFFSVMFIIANNAPEGSSLALKDLTATITYPDGLREAETTPPHITGTPIPVRCPGPDNKIGTSDDVDIILATFSGMAEFLAEGLEEGTHTVTVDFKGTLTGLPTGDTEVEGSASGTVVVRNPEFSVIFSHPEIVRYGEEYDIFMTLTNTSPVPANLVSLTMPASRLYGTELITAETPETVSFDTLEPGQSETVRFRMLSKQTGQVRATAFQAEGNVTGQFILTAGVGENGIPLSPDTLVLPGYAYSLADEGVVGTNALLGKDILNTAVIALGEAYSIATTPPGGLPEGLPYVNNTAVKSRVNDIAEAGQRVELGDTFLKSIEVLTLDWLGNRDADLSFDMLRRLTTKGIKSAEALSAVFNDALTGTTPAVFLESFAQTCSYKEPYFSAMLSFSSGQRTADLKITDYYGNRLTGMGDEPNREVPYGEIYMLDGGAQGPVDMALVGHFDENENALYTVQVLGQAEGTFDLSMIVPNISGGFRKITFSAVSCAEGDRSLVTVKGKDDNYALFIDLNGDGLEDDSPSYTDEAISEPQLELISAAQDCRIHAGGHAVALLFNRSVSAATANDKDNFFVDNKNIYATFLQPSERIIVVGLDNAVSPFVQSYIHVENLEDTNSGSMVSLPDEGMPITATITAQGGIVYGRVLTAEGKPVIGARVLLREFEDDYDFPTNSYTRTDSYGNYQFDFVRLLPTPFQIVAVDPNTNRVEKITAKLRVHAQRLQMDIYMMGRGTITGKVLTGDGLPASYAVVYASSVDTDIPETFGVRCDLQGEYVITDVPMGTVNLRVFYYQQSAYLSTAITTPGETRTVNVTLADIQTGSVDGRVLLSDGVTPVEDSYIYLYRDGKPLGFWGKTDEEGVFTFQDVPVGEVVVHCYDPRTGKIARTVTGNLTEGETFSSVIIFRGNAGISGTVWNFDHTIGMEGILVYIENTPFHMTTGSGGTFSFTDVPVGTYEVKAYDESTGKILSTQASLNYENETVSVSITFPAPIITGYISGTVTDASPGNADGVTVTLSDGNFYHLATASTDENGDFMFPELPPGRYVLSVKTAYEAGVAAATVYSGQGTSAGIQLVGMGTINVNVYANDGVSRVMADVDITSRKFKVDEGNYIGFTNSESHYTSSLSGPIEIRNVFCGSFSAKASNAFYPRGIISVGTLAAPNDVSTVDLVMEALGKVNVTVVSYDGETVVPGAKLTFTAGAGSIVRTLDTTGEDGTKEYTLVPAGGFSIEAWDQMNDFYGQVYGSMGRDGETVAVELRLKGRAAVNGTVKNSSGEGVQGVEVTLRNTSYPYETFETTSGEYGVFSIPLVSEGDFAVEVFEENTGLAGRASGTITGHGQDVTGFEVFLEPCGSVTGRILQPDGETLTQGAQVTLWKSGISFGFVSVSDSGSFHFDYLPIGDYWLSAYEPATGRDGSASFSVQVDGESVEADVRLKGRGTILGTVFDGSGTIPVPYAQVTLKRTGTPNILTSCDSEGNFIFEYIAEGVFSLNAYDETTQLWGEAEGEIEYDEQNVTVNVFMKGTGTISGTVYEYDGTTTVKEASIELKGAIDDSTTSNSEDGTYTFTNVPVGSFSITASYGNRPDKAYYSGTIDYHGQEKTIDLTFEGMGSVSGTVMHIGEWVNGVDVILTSGYNTSTVTTIDEGNFTFPSVWMGPFSIKAVHPTDTTLSASASGVMETAGQALSYSLELGASGTVHGTVMTPGGVTAADGAYVTLHGTSATGNYTLYTTTGADGTFQFNTVRLGSFYLQFLDKLGDGRQTYLNGTISQAGDDIDTGTLTLDNISPTVTSITPANGSTSVYFDPAAPTVSIVIQFSEDIDPGSLSGIRLFENGTSIVPTVAHSANTVTLTASVTSFKLYSLTIDGTVKDAAGNPLATPVSSTFTTEDREGPVVSAFDPADGTQGVSPNAVITVVFNEPIDTAQFSAANITVATGGTPVTGTLAFTGNKMSVQFTPDTSLATDSTYTVTVQNSTDIYGNVQSQAYSGSFATTDTIAPTLQLTAPNGTSVIEGGTGTVSADTGGAADVTQVFFFIDGQFTGSLETAPYNFSFTAPLINQSGDTFLVEAYALDSAGNQSNRANLQFTLIGDGPPQLSISGPTDPSIYPGHSVNVTLYASDDLSLQTLNFTAPELSINDSLSVTGTNYTKTYTLEIPNDMQPGSTVTLNADVLDSRDQLATAATLILQVPQDEELPTVTLTAPTSGQEFNYNETFTIQAEVSDDVGLDEVIFYKDNEILQSFDKPAVDSVLETTYHVLNAVEDLNVVFKAVAVDLVGKQSESQVTVTFKELINETLPSVKIISPTDGSLVFPGENLTLKVEISNDVENSIQQVTFRKDGTDLQVVDIPEYTGTTCSAEITYTIPTDAVIGSSITFEILALHVTGDIGSNQSIVGVVTGEFLDDGTVIAAGDTTYDNNDILIIKNGTVTINGTHSFKHILVKETGTLTHTGADTTEEFNMDLTLSGKLVVGLDAKLDISSRGYLGANQGSNASSYGRTLGNVTDIGSNYMAGGSYGGYGARMDEAQLNEMYGSITDPVNPGSGGGGHISGYDGGNGGGVLLLDAPEVIVDGGIYSNGGSSGAYASGGSGGSIRIDVTTLKGSGEMTANGGNCSSNNSTSGGGGRIAVYYQDASAFDPSKIVAYGGTYIDGSDSARNASAGTVYLKEQGETGQLIINNRAQQSFRPSIFPLVEPAVGTSVSGNVLTGPTDAAYMTDSLKGMKLIPDIEEPETTYTITGNTNNTITVDGTITNAGSGDTYSVVMVFNEHLIISNTPAELNREVELSELTVRSNGSITHAGATTTSTNYLSLTAGTITIESGSSIDSSERGYLGANQGDMNTSQYGRTLGNVNGSYLYSAASYGGLGGKHNSHTVNDVYGSPYNPVYPGSGGGGSSTTNHGGSGGGVLRISATEIHLDGYISSNGGNAGSYAGGGSGGSIRIDVTTLKGSGEIKANGGDCYLHSAGGGGRIAIYYQNADEFDLGKINTFGGIHTFPESNIPEYNGSAGTVYLEKAGQRGQLIVDNNSTETSEGTPLTTAAPGTITALNGYLLTDSEASFVPGSLVGMLLQPNTENTETFTIIANTGTEIEVEHTVDLTTVAAVGDNYLVKHRANLVLEDSTLHIAGDVTLLDMTLNNSQLVMNGTLILDNLILQGGSTVTHPTATTETTYSLRIEADEIVIDEGCSIDVTARGYLGGYQGTNESSYGRTLDNGDGSYYYSGAGYGGYSGQGYYSTTKYKINDIYGSLSDPVDPGSGGGASSTSYKGGNGGGVIRINSPLIQLNGSIVSNGGATNNYAGGGSGGSIRIDVTTLTGTGSIRAHGGESTRMAAGGGGRIAVYYTNVSQFDLANITAYGGEHTYDSNTVLNGSAGTVYLKEEGETPQLIINNNGKDSYKPLVFPVIAPAAVTSVSGSVLTGPTDAGYMPGSLTGMKLIPNIENPETFFTITANDANTITVAGDLTGAVETGDIYKGVMVFEGNLTIDNTNAAIDHDLEVDELIITGSGSLAHSPASTTSVSYLSVTADSITVDSGSSIDVTERGYLGGNREDNTTNYGLTLGNVNGSYSYCGGAYGGLGGQYSTNVINDVYGSLYLPVDPGSGGGATNGGCGGGVLSLTTSLLQLNGNIASNGGSVGSWGGGGSGGAIQIHAGILSGSGTITANGGNSLYGGAGGGGRIAVYYETLSGFDLTNITAYGGIHTSNSDAVRNGGAGTVFLKISTETSGDLIVDNNNTTTRADIDSTPLPAVGQGTSTTLDANTLENTGASFIPGALAGIKLNPYPTGSVVFTIISNTGTQILTDPTDGSMTQFTPPVAYIGEHYLRNLTVTGLAKVSTTDRIQVSGTMVVDAGAALTAENIQ